MEKASGDILIVTAHSSEAEAVGKAAAESAVSCDILVTGVGGMAMSWSLQKKISEGIKPWLVINAGICGSYRKDIEIGDVVMAESDCFADMGIDDNGHFVTLFRADLAEPNQRPFKNGRIISDNRWIRTLGDTYRKVSGATVNMASGSEAAIERIRTTWDPDIETMEGAWAAYVCAMNEIEYLSLRAVSNMVEPRNVKNWDIAAALLSLQGAMADILKKIENR